MKTYLINLIPKIRKYSQQLDDTTILTNKHWVLLGENQDKTVYIFRKINNQLLISKNGLIEKANWEHIGNGSIIIDLEGKSYLFKHGFIDDSVLALKLDGTNEYALFINESVYEKYLDSLAKVLSFLEDNYLNKVKNNSLNSSIRNTIKKTESNFSGQQNTLSKVNEIEWPDDDELKYTFQSSYPESEFRVFNQRGKWGYVDKDKNVVIDFEYDDAFPFSEGLAVVQINNKKGFINKSGEIKIEFQFDSASYFKNGKSTVIKNNEKFVIDKLGQKITTAKIV